MRVWSRAQGSCIQTLAKRCEAGHVVGSRSRPVNEVIAMQTKHYATRPDVTTLISGAAPPLCVVGRVPCATLG